MKIVSILNAFLHRPAGGVCSKLPSWGYPSGGYPSGGYYINGSKICYNAGFDYIEVDGADIRSFEKLDGESGYARDKNQIYLHGRVIKGADPHSFVRLHAYFSRDTYFIYYHGIRLSGDPVHFAFVDDHVQKDRRHVYKSGYIISDDPANFRLLVCIDGFSYYSDKNKVYVNGNPLDGADPSTFKPLRHGYSCDASRVYEVDGTAIRVIKEAEPAGFHVFNPYYTYDSKQVFWNGKTVPGADPAIFAALNSDDATGIKSEYYFSKRALYSKYQSEWRNELKSLSAPL